MRSANFRAYETRAIEVLHQAGLREPVDLAAVARVCKVHTLEFRNMLLDGALEPVAGGFKIYLYDQECERETELTSEIRLSRRQRFTLAHEIGHTFFFDTRVSTPTRLKTVPPYHLLESLCDRIASELLLPETLLKACVKRWEPLSAQLVLRIADRLDASFEAVLRRFARSPDLVSSNRAVLLLEPRRNGDVYIVAQFIGAAMLPLIGRPRRDAGSLTQWNSALSSNWTGEESDWKEVLRGISVKQVPYPTSRKRYFLEVAPTEETSPAP